MAAAEASVWATLAATAATAIATAVLTWFTWVMARATKRMAEAASQPNVVATMEPSRWSFIHMDVVIENTGNGPAFDVDLAFTPPLQRERGGENVDVPFNRITVLRPHYPIRNWVGDGASYLEQSHKVVVSWAEKPRSKSRQTISYELNLRHFEGVSMLGSGDPLVKIAEEAKKIREELHRDFGSLRRLKVDIYDRADRKHESAAMEERLRRENESAPPKE